MSEPASAQTRERITALYELPLPELLYQAQQAHRRHFEPGRIQAATLVSVKTGACPEDCAYCAQSARYDTGLEREGLVDVDYVRDAARRARDAGATRLCMGAAWRGPRDRDLDALAAMVEAVKAEGLEACLSAGHLAEGQAERLAHAGLDYFNHNLDTSAAYYEEIVSTRSYQERLETLERIRRAGIRVCSGGIVGLGESRADRVDMLATLADLPAQPHSVPINQLIPIPGTPLEEVEAVDPFEVVRTIAVARIAMPATYVRLAAGRERMGDELQALCFAAGANSIFFGERLLTTANAATEADQRLLGRLGLELEPHEQACAEL